MAMSIVLSILGLGAVCALLYNFAVYALPAFVGLSVGVWAIDAGAGPIGGIVVGLIAGVANLVVGQMIFTSGHSPTIRCVVALVFAASASYAGYHLMLQVLGFGVPSELWQQMLAAIGALAIGCTAIARLVLPRERATHLVECLKHSSPPCRAAWHLDTPGETSNVRAYARDTRWRFPLNAHAH